MRSLAGTVLVFVLAALLMVTTPIGTGEGIHQDELLHPVFPHLHMIDGRIVSHDQADARAAANTPRATRRVNGPAVEAGAGVEDAGLGVAIYPSLPVQLLAVQSNTAAQTAPLDFLPPDEFLDAPPDPPPNLAG